MEIQEKNEVRRLIREALQEDIWRGDVTTQVLIPATERVRAVIIAEEAAVVAGISVALSVFQRLEPWLKTQVIIGDGLKVKKGAVVGKIHGRARTILSAERVALNFLSRLSGIATLTSQFVGKVSPLQTQILDTRKTTPGWRALEKYAVRVGGGNNHRQGLYDQILIKDNHVAVLGRGEEWKTNREKFWNDLFTEIRKKNKKRLVTEVEVHFPQDLFYVLANHPDWILVDNFTPAQVRKAVALRNQIAPDVLMEASGGITLENAHWYAQTGVDALAIGRLTHSVRSINFSLEILTK